MKWGHVRAFFCATFVCTAALYGETSMISAGVEVLAEKIVSAFKESTEEQYKNNLAVYEFASVGEDAKKNEIGKTIASLLTTELKRTGEFDIVDRDNLDKALEEMELSMSGLVDEESAVEVGKMLAANIFLHGDATEVEGRYYITVRMTDVETGEVILSEEVNFAKDKLNSMATLLFAERKQPATALFRSVLLPGWGQFYNNQPVKGVICSSLFFASAGGALTFTTLSQTYYARYENHLLRDATDIAAAREDATWYYDTSATFQDIALYSLIGYGAILLYSAIDAFIVARGITRDIEDAKKSVAFAPTIHPSFLFIPENPKSGGQYAFALTVRY